MTEHQPNEPFTVIWRYTVDGIARERILEADQVHVAYDNRNSGDPNQAMLGAYSVGASGLVVIGDPGDGGKSMALAFGNVYVMNAHGKTVATYKLADPDRVFTGDAAQGEFKQPAEQGVKSARQLATEAGAKFDKKA